MKANTFVAFTEIKSVKWIKKSQCLEIKFIRDNLLWTGEITRVWKKEMFMFVFVEEVK